MGYRELQLSVALNVYRYYTHPFNCKVMFFLVDWSSLAIRDWQLDLSTHSPRPQTRKPHAFISPLPLLLLLFLKADHHQATELALLLQQQLLLSFTGTHMVVMIRHVLDVAGLAALEDLFLARTFAMLPHSSRFSFAPIFLSSRQALLCCTAPPSLPSLPLGCSLLLVDLHNHSTCLTFAINQPKINHRSSLILMICNPHDPR